MGSFITNIHVRDADRDAVIEALRSLGVVPAYVRGSPETTWISIFPEAADQNDAALPDMARALSKALKRPVIGFIVHDSDILLDRYNSAPGYFTDEETPPEGGNPEALAVYCNTSADRLARLLHPEEARRSRRHRNRATATR
jgi:hypothetical protein